MERERCCEWELSGAPDERLKSISSFCQYWDEGGRGCARDVARIEGERKGEKEAEGRKGRESMRTERYRQAGRQTDRWR